MKCNLCPNKCNINRLNNIGFCGVGDELIIASYSLHKYEEPIISGTNGSGTVFFCGCSLKCVFCQNFELSRAKRGKIISPKELADIFLELEQSGAHNINLVNPTHYAKKIIEAFKIYKPKIPIVYNTHGYENLDALKNIDEYIDIYLPDMKFFSNDISYKYSKKSDYFEKASKAIEFMTHKPLIFDDNGLIKSGTVVRHLCLPQNIFDSKKVIDWFCNIKDKAYIHLMSQYTPFGDIDSFPELKRKLTKREYNSIVDYCIEKNIQNAFIQDLKSSSEDYIPIWKY